MARRRALSALAGLLGLASVPLQAASAKPPEPTTLAELQSRVEDILHKTHVPAAGIALVNRDGPLWVAGVGLADVASRRPATPDTLFRIGSVSKGFVSLSILKLQEEGKLSLLDTLRSRVPDLAFENPWEATDPVRLVHLLEHTAGWDDLPLSEFALDRTPEMSLREGLAFNPRTRTSRWRPGTRYSYSNEGPPAAAYVVERVTGQRFEDYVEATWFKPLGMDTASYFDTPQVRRLSATLYHADGTKPFPYWHIDVRPAGAINASPREMAHYLEFYLNRGSYHGVRLLPAAAIDRMEVPTTTYAAREGLKIGYGLSNVATVRGPWVFHGHDGGVMGGLTHFAYQSEIGVGYVVMINAGNPEALRQLSELIAGYLLRGHTPPALPAETDPSPVARRYSGWYEPVSPRAERTRGMSRILGLRQIRVSRKGLLMRSAGAPSKWVAVSERLFRHRYDGAPTLALIADASEGTLIQLNGETFLRIPPWLPYLEFGVIAATLLLAVSSCVFASIWIPRRLFGELRQVRYIRVRALPALASLCFGLMFVAYAVALSAPLERLALPNVWSIAIFVLSLAFAFCAVAGLVQAIIHRRDVARLVWWHAFAASAFLSVAAAYLAYWGLIGIRTWA